MLLGWMSYIHVTGGGAGIGKRRREVAGYLSQFNSCEILLLSLMQLEITNIRTVCTGTVCLISETSQSNIYDHEHFDETKPPAQ